MCCSTTTIKRKYDRKCNNEHFCCVYFTITIKKKYDRWSWSFLVFCNQARNIGSNETNTDDYAPKFLVKCPVEFPHNSITFIVTQRHFWRKKGTDMGNLTHNVTSLLTLTIVTKKLFWQPPAYFTSREIFTLAFGQPT